MEPAVTVDEPTPLKAVSVSSVSGDAAISGTSNGAVISHDSSSTHGAINGAAAANAADASSDIPLTSL